MRVLPHPGVDARCEPGVLRPHDDRVVARLHDIRRAVGRSVVDDDHCPRFVAECLRKAVKQCIDVISTVVCHDHGGHGRAHSSRFYRARGERHRVGYAWRVGKTLGGAFDPRRNSLNGLRLVLAVLVIVSHSWPIGGYGHDPGDGDLTLGEWAVAGFFAISGYLITSSRLHSRTLLDYLWRRVLRIYPAFLIVLLVVGFVFAPLSVMISGSGSWTPLDGFGYLWHNLGLRITQMGIPGTLEGAAYPEAWNGSLWTLWYEFLCYLVMGLLVSVIPRRHLGRFAIVLTVVCTASTIVLMAIGTPSLALLNAVTLGGYFGAGAILYCYRDKVPLSWKLAIVSVVVIAISIATATFRVLAGLPVAYLMMWLGTVLPLQRLAAKNDVSYGMYVYAFPVQQLLGLTLLAVGAANIPVWAFIALSVAFTVPFAWLSWALVERPAMRFKGLVARRWPGRRETAGPPERV